MKFTWNEVKRGLTISKPQLDIADAEMVLGNPYRLDLVSFPNGQERDQSFAFVSERLAVLTVVHLPGEQPQIISFRSASRVDREIYHDWLENDFKDFQPASLSRQNCACWRGLCLGRPEPRRTPAGQRQDALWHRQCT